MVTMAPDPAARSAVSPLVEIEAQVQARAKGLTLDLVADRVLRNLAGYGPLEPLLADDDVWEVMVGPRRQFSES
jgi:Flp pilus assembly CpaF family ATPase